MNTKSEFIQKLTLKSINTDKTRVVIKESLELAHYLYNHVYDTDTINVYESCYAVFFNSRGEIFSYCLISQGNDFSVAMDIKMICQYAILSNCIHCAITHNHPSGVVQPGLADKTQTKKLKQALELFEIKLFDHIIISSEKDTFYSFADHGLI